MDYLKTKGRIFNIQRFSIHDGPGIRTIVFFKGCFMRCAWCCNPESQEYKIETMYENGVQKTVGKDVTVEELMPEILADLPYFRRSGGGVTLSGGEILAQPDFARDLLRACKNAGLSTAVESTANAPFSEIEKILPYLDLYLIHWPNPVQFRSSWKKAMQDTWKAFEELYEAGKIKAVSLPHIQGHEPAGIVAEVGECVDNVGFCCCCEWKSGG